MTGKKPKCPRCKSLRLAKRLRGENYCLRCGQRWHGDGMLIRSFDKRSLSKSFVPSKEEQLPLIEGAGVKICNR